MEQFANEGSATLSGAIISSVTSLTVTGEVNTPSTGTFRVRIEDEFIKVTAVSSHTWTVVRGQEGSTAASHADTTPIHVIVTKAAVDALVNIQSNGSETSNRRILNFIGGTVADNSGSSRVDITIPNFESPVTIPVLTDYTWVNQGSATGYDDGQGIYVNAPATSQNSLKCLVLALSSGTWTYKCKLIPALWASGNPNCGPIIRESSSGKLIAVRNINTSIDMIEFNSATSFSGTALGATALNGTAPFVWFKIQDDGTTNRVYSISVDGTHWIDFFSHSRSSFFVADQVGFYIEGANSGYDNGVKCVSATLTYP